MSTFKKFISEVKMSPSVFAKFAKSPVAQEIMVGAEFELYFRGALEGNVINLPEITPSITMDEVEAAIFEYNSDGAQRLQEKWYEFQAETFDDWFSNNQKELTGDYIIDKHEDDLLRYLNSEMNLVDEDTLEEILSEKDDYPRYESSREFKEKASENQKAYSELSGELAKKMDQSWRERDQFLEAALGEVDGYANDWDDHYRDEVYDKAYEDYLEEHADEISLYEFLRYNYSADWETIARAFNGDYSSSEEGWDDSVVESLAENLSRALDVPTTVSSEYGNVSVELGDEDWVFEPDGSVTGQGDEPEDLGVEIKTPPMPLPEFIEKFEKFLDWAIDESGYTNKNTGLHISMSIGSKKIDYVKLVLFAGADKVSADFGRSANSYASSSIKELEGQIQNRESQDPLAIKSAFDAMRIGMMKKAGQEISNGNSNRYVQVNFKGNYVEFRAPGGDYLQASRLQMVKDTVYRFAYAVAIASDPEAEKQEYAKKLAKMLSGSGKEDLLVPFVMYSTGIYTKEILIQKLKQRTLQRAVANVDMTKLNIKQILKDNGFQSANFQNRRVRASKFQKVDDIFKQTYMGKNPDSVSHRYILSFEDGMESMVTVYPTKQGTIEILGITDQI